MTIRGRLLELGFFATLLIGGAIMLALAWEMPFWEDDSVGPGAYPKIVLVVLIAVSGGLLAGALRSRHVTMVSPFLDGLQDDVQLRSAARRVAALVGRPVRVQNRPGEGRFSALWTALRAEPDGETVTIVSSDTSQLPNFRAAAFVGRRLVPIAGVYFDPDAILVPAGSALGTIDDLVSARSPGGRLRIGLCHHPDLAHGVDRWLAGAGAAFDPHHEPDPRALLRQVEAGEVDAAVMGLADARQAIESGSLRCIGVMADELPSWAPDVPLVGRAGHPAISGRWAALVTAPGLAEERRKDWEAAFVGAASGAAGGEQVTRPWTPVPGAAFARLVEAHTATARAIGEPLEAPAVPSGKTAALVVAIAGLAIWPFAMPRLGFPLAAFVFCFVLTVMLGPRLSARTVAIAAIVAAVLSVGSYALFWGVFGVVFPAASLFGA